jgi:hypothetical protein
VPLLIAATRYRELVRIRNQNVSQFYVRQFLLCKALACDYLYFSTPTRLPVTFPSRDQLTLRATAALPYYEKRCALGLRLLSRYASSKE